MIRETSRLPPIASLLVDGPDTPLYPGNQVIARLVRATRAAADPGAIQRIQIPTADPLNRFGPFAGKDTENADDLAGMLAAIQAEADIPRLKLIKQYLNDDPDETQPGRDKALDALTQRIGRLVEIGASAASDETDDRPWQEHERHSKYTNKTVTGKPSGVDLDAVDHDDNWALVLRGAIVADEGQFPKSVLAIEVLEKLAVSSTDIRNALCFSARYFLDNQHVRIRVFDRPDLESTLAAKSTDLPRGEYNPHSRTEGVFLAARNRTAAQLAQTLLHELTHLNLTKIYDNSSVPYRAQEQIPTHEMELIHQEWVRAVKNKKAHDENIALRTQCRSQYDDVRAGEEQERTRAELHEVVRNLSGYSRSMFEAELLSHFMEMRFVLARVGMDDRAIDQALEFLPATVKFFETRRSAFTSN